jgi:hypothetical protein
VPYSPQAVIASGAKQSGPLATPRWCGFVIRAIAAGLKSKAMSRKYKFSNGSDCKSAPTKGQLKTTNVTLIIQPNRSHADTIMRRSLIAPLLRSHAGNKQQRQTPCKCGSEDDHYPAINRAVAEAILKLSE